MIVRVDMWFFGSKRIRALGPDEPVNATSREMPPPTNGDTPFDEMRAILGLPPWWRDEWFMPGVAVPKEMREIAREWRKSHGG